MLSNAKLFITFSNRNFKQQIEYAFRQLLLPLGIEHHLIMTDEIEKLRPYDLIISYGKNRPRTKTGSQIHIYESNFFGDDYRTEASMPECPLEQYGDLPVIYSGHGKVDGFVKSDSHLIETNIDIIASSFFMLARYEEVLVNERDKFERFPATASIAYKESFLERPIVNEYIELLWSWIDSFNLGFKRKKLWDNKDFAVCLTHDVDKILLYNMVRHVLGTIFRTVIKQKKPGNLVKIAQDYTKTRLGLQKDPYDKFEIMLQLEQKLHFYSSFYFMAGGSTKYDNRYHIKNIRNIVKLLNVAKCEIGLHGSFDSYHDSQMIHSEKVNLEEIKGSDILGSRQHYLRWKTPETWRALEKAGLKYDTTLSFADHIGFRCGICYPYRPFDIFGNRMLDIWEIPLIVMEESLFGYQNLSSEEGLRKIQLLIDIVEQYKGVFVTLWHNSSFYELENPNMLDVYKETLDYVSDKNVLCDSVEAVLTTWLKTIEM